MAHAIQDLHSLRTPLTDLSDESLSTPTADTDIGSQRKGLVFVELTCPAHPEDGDDQSRSHHSQQSDHDSDDERRTYESYMDYCRADSPHRSDNGGDGGNSDTGDGGGTGAAATAWQGGKRAPPSPPLLSPLEQVDRMAQQLYQAAPVGTLLLVVTQGSMQAMKLLASRKIR